VIEIEKIKIETEVIELIEIQIEEELLHLQNQEVKTQIDQEKETK
jgi:hypothetical protein